ncbi:hypothetical protein [Amycolatopsis suaedae]|uniref:Uncharacterized protein n=1 Tax=Amycolatopsis suaedae TaxID=2510978 RepID=A0A4Q7JC06_9PSEU|nr:hypothetical protein [Amycolatopsis suaedae]RZQ65390.1 hypothetical protein EWH70_05835 [Amycolatopsis suaedae]
MDTKPSRVTVVLASLASMLVGAYFLLFGVLREIGMLERAADVTIVVVVLIAHSLCVVFSIAGGITLARGRPTGIGNVTTGGAIAVLSLVVSALYWPNWSVGSVLGMALVIGLPAAAVVLAWAPSTRRYVDWAESSALSSFGRGRAP